MVDNRIPINYRIFFSTYTYILELDKNVKSLFLLYTIIKDIPGSVQIFSFLKYS